MLKKVLISFLFAIFVLVSLYTNICYAESAKVTKENLTKTFEELVLSDSNEDNMDVLVEDDVIKFTVDNETCVVNYDLTGEPTFSTEISIEKGMSYEEVVKKIENLALPMLGYAVVAKIQGVEFQDSLMYYALTSAEEMLNSSYATENPYVIVDDLNNNGGIAIEKTDDPKTIYTSEFGDRVMEYVNAVCPEVQTESDSNQINSYTATTKRQNTTETSCKLLYTITVNTDADFSKIKGYTDEMFENDGADDEKNNSNDNKINSKVEVNIQKLPQTGEEKNVLLIALYTIIGICSITLITLLFISKKKK